MAIKQNQHDEKTVLTVDSWLGRALSNMPAPTGKPLDGWERFEPRMKGFRYRRELEDGTTFIVSGGPRKGWGWHVLPPHTGKPRHPISIGFSRHLDFAMMGAEQYETLPTLITLSAFDAVQYDPQSWEITFSGLLTQGTVRILAKHAPAQQTYSIGVLNNPGPGVLAYGAVYIPEMSIFYPVKDHQLVHELGQQAIWAYLHESGAIDDDGKLCVFPYDPDDETEDIPTRLQ